MGQEDEAPWVIEMFVDDVSGIGLWDRSGGPAEWEMSEDVSEDNLPMPDDLRQRIKTWVDEYTDSIGNPVVRRRWTMDHEVEHDVRGYELSRDLQRVLGPTFRIDYKFHTDEAKKSVQGEQNATGSQPLLVVPALGRPLSARVRATTYLTHRLRSALGHRRGRRTRE